MPWQDRIAEAAYTSPGGLRLVFVYENVSKSFDKKTSAFNFPDAQGTFVQDLGHTGRRYPLRVIFWGDDYDLEADQFELMLQESGIGRLEHPKYGLIEVVPFGTISRRDNLKTEANQAIIEVTFWETIGAIYPSSQSNPSDSVLESITEYNSAFSEEFEDVMSLGSIVEQAILKSPYNDLLNSVVDGLSSVADVQDNIKKEFDTIEKSINTGIDVLLAEPLTLAFQTILLIQAPARAEALISDRLDGYKNLVQSIVAGDGAVLAPTNDTENSNLFHTRDLYASTMITGMILSTVENQFVTKMQALEAAETIIDQSDAVFNWRDDNFKSLEEIDTGSSYQQIQESVALVTGFLIEISFNLKQERRLLVTRNRTAVDLVFELYGSVDDQLDFFISSNDLTGSEILEIPRGREIVYYI